MNAIILAAGMGTRLRPLTDNKPKCLVEVCGVPMIERQIQYLHETDITDITVVSGYKADKLDYLKEKYGVEIILNDKYDIYNNIYSLYRALERFGDTYVVEGDIFLNEKCFTKDISHSTYFSVWKENYENEWGLKVDKDSRLREIVIGSGQGYIMSGVSYWTKEDALKISTEIKRLISINNYTDLFWDNAVINLLSILNIYVKPINNLFEIDTLKDLALVESLVCPDSTKVSKVC